MYFKPISYNNIFMKNIFKNRVQLRPKKTFVLIQNALPYILEKRIL